MDYIPFLPTFSRDYYGLELIHNAVVIAIRSPIDSAETESSYGSKP